MENQTVNPQIPQVENTYDPTFKELGPNDRKVPRKIPVLKIIISFLVFSFLVAVLVPAIYYIKHQDKYLKVAEPAAVKVAAILSPYPTPGNNICGDEAKICPGGDVTVKQGLRCEFVACPESGSDMTKFWTITNASRPTRTYKNLDLKYEFTAPSNWQFIGKDSGLVLYSPDFDCTDSNNCKGTSIGLTSSLTTGKSDIEDWYKSDENIIAKNLNKTPAQLNNYKVTEVAGLKAIENNDRTNARTLYFINDSTVFILNIKSSTDNDYINGNKVFDNIISSFKFENPTPAN